MTLLIPGYEMPKSIRTLFKNLSDPTMRSVDLEIEVSEDRKHIKWINEPK